MSDELVHKIAGLLDQAGEIHHVVFSDTDGVDDDWASFYSSCLLSHGKLGELLGAATLKLNDRVILIGKLAAAPQGNAPAFDGTCEVYSSSAPVAVAPISHGAASPDITVSIDKLEADASSIEAAFNTKYIGKAVRLTGGKVSHVGTDVVTVYHLSGPHNMASGAPFFPRVRDRRF